MIFVEITQSGGRSAHKMKDFLGGFAFFFIYHFKLIYNETWVFPENDCNNHVAMYNILDPDIVVERPTNEIIYVDITKKTYKYASKGMPFHEVERIYNELVDLQNKNSNCSIIYRMKHIHCPIKVSDVYNWEKMKLIKNGTYKKFTDYLKYRYSLTSFTNHKYLPIEKGYLNVVVHIRKGDVFNTGNKDKHNHHNIDYFVKIIDNFKKLKLPLNIIILSETWNGYNGDDVRSLENKKDGNTLISIILEKCLYEYFMNVIEKTDVFVSAIGYGGFSDLVSIYKNDNTILILNDVKRHYRFDDSMNNEIIKTTHDGDFDVNLLKKNILDKT